MSQIMEHGDVLVFQTHLYYSILLKEFYGKICCRNIEAHRFNELQMYDVCTRIEVHKNQNESSLPQGY